MIELLAMWGKSKPKKCPNCQGLGFVHSLQGNLGAAGNNIEVDKVRYALCPKCRGVGIVGIKELESLNATQLQALVKNETYDAIFSMFNDKKPEEIKSILAEYIK